MPFLWRSRHSVFIKALAYECQQISSNDQIKTKIVNCESLNRDPNRPNRRKRTTKQSRQKSIELWTRARVLDISKPQILRIIIRPVVKVVVQAFTQWQGAWGDVATRKVALFTTAQLADWETKLFAEGKVKIATCP